MTRDATAAGAEWLAAVVGKADRLEHAERFGIVHAHDRVLS